MGKFLLKSTIALLRPAMGKNVLNIQSNGSQQKRVYTSLGPFVSLDLSVLVNLDTIFFSNAEYSLCLFGQIMMEVGIRIGERKYLNEYTPY